MSEQTLRNLLGILWLNKFKYTGYTALQYQQIQSSDPPFTEQQVHTHGFLFPCDFELTLWCRRHLIIGQHRKGPIKYPTTICKFKWIQIWYNPTDFERNPNKQLNTNTVQLETMISSMSFDILSPLIFVFELLQGTIIGGTLSNSTSNRCTYCVDFVVVLLFVSWSACGFAPETKTWHRSPCRCCGGSGAHLCTHSYSPPTSSSNTFYYYWEDYHHHHHHLCWWLSCKF